MYAIVYDRRALKDIPRLRAAGFTAKAQEIVAVLRKNPWQNPPPYEKLIGDLRGLCSRRINIKHRLVYQVIETARTVKIVSMWSHYER